MNITRDELAQCIYDGIVSCAPVDWQGQRLNEYAAIWANAAIRNIETVQGEAVTP